MKNYLDRFVSLRDEAGAADGGGAGAAGGVDVAALQAELATLKAADAQKTRDLDAAKLTITQKEEAAQFWHQRATGKGEAPRVVEPDPADDIDLLDVIGTKGTKGLTSVLKKQGIVTMDQVQDVIAQNVDRITREGKAVERFPELKDQTSELYKLTKSNIAALAKDGIKGVAATEIAAERAYLTLVDEGKMKPAAQRKAEAEAAAGGDDEEEEERVARANAAGGAPARRTPGKTNTRASETAEDKVLLNRICAEFGITEEQYRKRADKGVQFGK